jgi:hypothetical protein
MGYAWEGSQAQVCDEILEKEEVGFAFVLVLCTLWRERQMGNQNKCGTGGCKSRFRLVDATIRSPVTDGRKKGVCE